MAEDQDCFGSVQDLYDFGCLWPIWSRAILIQPLVYPWFCSYVLTSFNFIGQWGVHTTIMWVAHFEDLNCLLDLKEVTEDLKGFFRLPNSQHHLAIKNDKGLLNHDFDISLVSTANPFTRNYTVVDFNNHRRFKEWRTYVFKKSIVLQRADKSLYEWVITLLESFLPNSVQSIFTKASHES